MGCPTECFIGDNLSFSITTHDPDTGVLTDADADSLPAYRVYQEDSGSVIVGGDMALTDSGSTDGYYTAKIAISALNYSDGKTYHIYIAATVDGDKGGIVYSFVARSKIYHADCYLTVDGANSQDEYTVQWYCNGVPVTSGVTLPTIQVVKRSDGTDLVAAASMTQIGSTGRYKYDEDTSRLTAGEAAVAVVSATIAGTSRTWSVPVGRDSSA